LRALKHFHYCLRLIHFDVRIAHFDMSMLKTQRVRLLSFVFILAAGFSTVLAQKGKLEINYTIVLTDPAAKQFHITTEIKNIDQERLDLALPTWTPGWYTIENYAKNLLRFKVTDSVGKWLPLRMSRKQTWNIDTRTVDSIKVEYDYSATVLALNQAKIEPDFAYFIGTALFLEPVGHRSTPSTVRFKLPPNWRVITPLKDTADPFVFTAADYDTLVDAPAEMGKFDLTKFEVDGKPHYFAANPAGSFSPEKTKKFVEMLQKVVRVESAVFGDIPYEKYVYFYFFRPAESNASGALEHLNSFVAFAPPGEYATPERLIGTAAHEFFHLWNVKRLRPAEMWPYDYSRENETPLLWVSEGFTNYYSSLTLYRAGIIPESEFLDRRMSVAAGIENNDVRNYISPASSSVSTWIGYDTPQPFEISYYAQGENLGALLDLSIRHDTGGRAGLDDVMRGLYNDFYKRGKGFTTDDMIAVLNSITKKDHTDFYRRYVFGTDVPDYKTIYGYAGYKVEENARAVPEFGFDARFRNDGLYLLAIETGGPAEKAGLRVDDVVHKVDGQPVRSIDFDTMAGKTLKLTVQRDGADIELPYTVGSRSTNWYSLVDMPNPTPEQRQVREAWLKR
jgi:predicted metalloprotease with PDZ domain